MDKILYAKLNNLKKIIREIGHGAIAFSGGVDSSLLVKIASDEISVKSIAITAHSPVHSTCDLEEAKKMADFIGIEHIIIHSDEMAMKEFTENNRERCYICKKHFLSLIKSMTDYTVIDGSNCDDKNDYRPGMKAAHELGVRSPFIEAGFTKEDIRKIAFSLGLPDWNRQSSSCLASRIPYRTEITLSLLERIEHGEKLLFNLGFTSVRLRHHGNIARIELPEEDMDNFLSVRYSVVKGLKKLGYNYITLDLEGYRTGSLNEEIKK